MMTQSRILPIPVRILLLVCIAIGLSDGMTIADQKPLRQQSASKTASVRGSWLEADRAVAARFAPMIYQGIAGNGRFDFITNFDFDGDWIGDNNWAHAEDARFPQKGYVYWAVSETATHYFICYAFFHPRDWKGGNKSGRALSGTIREVMTLGQHVKSPPGLMDDLVLSHENDLEGCMVAVEKGAAPGGDQVVLMETVAHNKYLLFARIPYTPETEMLMTEGDRPVLYIEAKGHGVHGYTGQNMKPAEPVSSRRKGQEDNDRSAAGKIGGFLGKAKNITKAKNLVKTNKPEPAKPSREEKPVEEVRMYRFAGIAEDPLKTAGPVGYDLIPLYDTLWKHAQAGRSETYGEAENYGMRTILARVPAAPDIARKVVLGRLGAALRGKAGAPNKARPPWGWFDMSDRSRPLGEWFLDPAGTLLRHLGNMKNWSLVYLHNPFMQIMRDALSN